VTSDASALAAPAGYAIRRPTRDDLPAIAGFTALCDRHDVGGVDYTLSTFEHDWSMPAFDPTLDAWLVETSDGGIGAFGELARRPKMAPEVVGWVHPERRGLGLGSLLIDLTEARALEIVSAPAAEEPRAIVNWIHHDRRDAAYLLDRRGYRVTRSFLRMSIELGDEPPLPAEWPPGMELRPMRVGIDDEAVYQTITTAFRDHWGSSPLPFEQWRQVRMGASHFDPSLWLLAWSGDRLLGASLNGIEDGEAWVQTLGVLRGARGKGLGMALLNASFRAFHARGQRQVMLGVDAQSLTGATRLYERAGMKVDRQWDHWERELD
jgi:mycothiol synthase